MAVDISQFLTKIKDKQDRAVFKEAVICGANDALTACFLMLWVSLIQSLKRRFIEIGKHDKDTAKIVGTFQQMESQHKTVDKYLIDQGKEFGFYDDNTHNDLLYLFTKRSLIIHPYMSKITEESIIYAANIIVNEILGQPIKLRYSYCKNLINNLLEPHYLDYSEKVVIEFIKDVLKRIDVNIIKWFIDRYLLELTKLYEDRTLTGRNIILWRGIWIITYILEQRPTTYKKSEYHDRFIENPNILSWVLGKPSLYILMNNTTKHSVLQFIMNTYKDKPHFLRIIDRLFLQHLLEKRYVTQYNQLINDTEFRVLQGANLSFITMINKVYNMLFVWEFETNNQALDYIENNMYLMHDLDYEFQFQIGRRIIYLAKKQCFKAQSFIEDIIIYPLPIGLITGLLYANFLTDNNNFVKKYNYLEVTTKLLEKSTCKEEVINSLFIELDKLQYSFNNYSPEVLNEIKLKISDTDFKNRLLGYIKMRQDQGKEKLDG
ncbi:MAG TPA: hypothetical protein PLF50_01425 [Candidatus Cloacimonadota bacterium]|nr:hypothetical protein [Candidatus Cloacimonadota bacterium]